MRIQVKDLSEEEKLKLLRAKDRWHLEDLNGKLPSVMVSDGPVGLRVEKDGEHGSDLPAVGFPSIVTLANTWNTDMAREMGQCLADECIERNVDVLLAPGVNIKRTPHNGRNFEYFSEDPFLAGTMAENYIIGVQERGVGTCLKHFVCNNMEFDRFHQSSEVDERTLREIYYRPFEIACKAKPTAIMCSYNRVNGAYASENKTGFDVLRNDFGFDGVIFSDWNAVRDRNAALSAGLDVEYPYEKMTFSAFLKDHENGLVSSKDVDASCSRILDFIYATEERRNHRTLKTSVEERIKTSRRIAEEGIVLLKNNGVLPLRADQSVAVSGYYAKPTRINAIIGGGSAKTNWCDKTFDIPRKLSDYVKKVVYESCFYPTYVRSEDQLPERALAQAEESDAAVICCGTGAETEFESCDRDSLRLSRVQERCILDIAEKNANTIVVLFAGSAVDMSPWVDKVAAVLFVGFAGMGTDEAVAEILSGKVNPSGKLSETFPRNAEQVPANIIGFHIGKTEYSEKLDVGYRYYGSHGVIPLFSFGHGLSYSSFTYSGLKAECRGDEISLEYRIHNDSITDGKEISQVYVGERNPSVPRPIKELKAFSKDFIPAHQEKTIHVALTVDDLKHYSLEERKWVASEGDYEITVASSSEKAELVARINLKDGRLTVK